VPQHTLRLILAVLVGAAVTTGLAGSQLAAHADPAAGPPCEFTQEIMHSDVPPLKNRAMITRSDCGYRYHAGRQDSRLVVTRVEGGLRFADTGTTSWDRLTRACRATRARVGVAAVCKVPATVSTSRPLLIEVWPRLGDDYTDGSTLPATFALAVLGDAGNDVARLGAGPDFFNGAFGRDRVSGGAGNDWLRTGDDSDYIWGGAGNDHLVGVDGQDTIYGGAGNDRVGGSDGNDRLYAGDGKDNVLCGNGTDAAKVDRSDSVLSCESVDRG
jgi:hypothetical protein